MDKIRILLFLMVICIALPFPNLSLADTSNYKESAKHERSNKKKNDEDQEDSSPCDGLLALLNRPTHADSACVVPLNKLVGEMGYSFFTIHGGGSGHFLPEMQLRLGILGYNELFVSLPNYVSQTVTPRSGWTATSFGLKHELGFTKTSVASIEGILTPPSGSEGFGSAGWGGTANGIFEIDLTKKTAFTLMLGVSSLTEPQDEGGDRYNSFNQNLVLSWKPQNRLQFFVEVYGMTSTGAGEGAGANADIGIQYLLNKKLEVDLTFGQRIFGNLGGYNNYIDIGLGFMT